MTELNPNLRMPSWLIYALVGKVVLLTVIAATILYLTGVLG